MYKDAKGLWRQSVTINGRRKVFSAKTKKDLMLKIAMFKQLPPVHVTVKELADEWIDSIEVSPNTMKGYTAAHKKIVNDLGSLSAEALTPQKVTVWLGNYSNMAQKTITNLLLVLRQIMNYGCLHYALPTNPCDRVKAPKGTGKKQRDFPTQEDIEKVNRNIDRPFGLFMYSILYTGMRRGEACALRWKDIDFDTKRIHITKSSYWKNHIRYDKDPKSEAGEREVPLLDSLAAVLKERKGKPNELVFGDLKEYQVDKGVRKYCQESGLSCTPHGLRHGFASILFREGLDIKTIQYVLGHAQSSTTMEIYVHLMEEDKTASALKALENFTNKKQAP